MTKQEHLLDFDRKRRLGMVEAIWGEHKSYEQISEILYKFESSGEFALVTRVNSEKAERLLKRFKKAEFHSKPSCLTLGQPSSIIESKGKVVVLSGGSSDISVASEAELSLRWHGIQTELLMDIGVAGLHRVLDNLEKIKTAKVVIACAGMEGALPTVLAGLIPQPVIGVPVSVGYGVSAGGKAAIQGMLASCAPGLMVVNIDNGYGAAMAALRIINASNHSGALI